MKEPTIRRIPLFASLPQNEIQYLTETLRVVDFPANSLLLREGEYGDRFFVVLSGEIKIIKALGTSDEKLIDVRGAGEYIGEMSLLIPEGKRTASVRAHTAVQALEMTRADFDALLHRQPSVAYEMTRVLSMRLDEAHQAAIRDLQEKNRQLQEAYEGLQAAQAQIVEKEKLEHELQVARQIQESILPNQLPRRSGFDFGARMIPTRAVGGDFFDFVPLDDKRLGIAIADVSDKGMPAAIFMALTRSLLRAEAMRSKSPRRVLQNVNHLLLEMNNANMFVTMLYEVLDYATREFRYARAGHDAPLIIKAPHMPMVPRLGHSQPLGIFPDSPLDTHRIELARDDVLVMFTDGTTEAMNEREELFGAERLRDSALARCHLSAQTMCERLIDDISRYRGSAPQSDDIALVVVRVK